MNASDSQITARLQAYIRCMKTCSDPSVWRVHVNVQRVRQLAHCTFSCTHRWLGSLHNYRTHQTVGSQHVYMHVNVQWPVCLTCACKCAESQTICSLHISMHTSVTRLTPHLYEHIRQSDHCTFACTHQVHVNVKWPVCLTCARKCAESQTIGSPCTHWSFCAHCPITWTHQTVGSLHIYKHTSGIWKCAVTRVTDVCM